MLGQGSVPSRGVSAVAVTLTATDVDRRGYWTAWAGPDVRPGTSALNTEPGDTLSNTAIIPVAADGTIAVYSQSGGDLIVDVTGWFTDATAAPSTRGRLDVLAAPLRLDDTRFGYGGLTRLPEAVSTEVAIGGRGPITTDAIGVVGNLTTVAPSDIGYLTVYPAGAALPPTSTTNPTPDRDPVATAIMVGTGQAARRGIYIRNGEALETSSKLTTLVFDKTGTITEGKPVVTDFLAAESEDEAALATFVASAEAPSEHFLGQALAAWARSRGAKVRAAKDFNARPGRGVQAFVSGKTIRIGNAALLVEAGIDCGEFAAQAEAWSGEGKTPVFVAIGQRCAALLAEADRPREGAQEAIALLHRLGLTTVMATGDLEATAHHIARQVGIDQVVARATPADKLELVHRLQADGHKVGMVGDGINDAPALAAADVGFAIGSGADIALESADITLVGGDIARVASGIELSRRTMSVIRQNLFWALGYNTVAIPFAAAGRLNPMIASAAMAMSSVSVLSNSLRLQQNR